MARPVTERAAPAEQSGVTEQAAPDEPAEVTGGFASPSWTRGSVQLRHVDAGSCNGCEIEIASAFGPVHDAARFGAKLVASPRHADGVLVTGVVTHNMAGPLEKTFEAVPRPRVVVACGDCALNGGCLPVHTASPGSWATSSTSTSRSEAVPRPRPLSPRRSEDSPDVERVGLPHRPRRYRRRGPSRRVPAGRQPSARRRVGERCGLRQRLLGCRPGPHDGA